MNNYIPQRGDLFLWCEEQYFCIQTGSYSGTAKPIGETYYIRGFIWNYGGETPVFVRKATDNELENMGLK